MICKISNYSNIYQDHIQNLDRVQDLQNLNLMDQYLKNQEHVQDLQFQEIFSVELKCQNYRFDPKRSDKICVIYANTGNNIRAKPLYYQTIRAKAGFELTYFRNL